MCIYLGRGSSLHPRLRIGLLLGVLVAWGIFLRRRLRRDGSLGNGGVGGAFSSVLRLIYALFAISVCHTLLLAALCHKIRGFVECYF